MPPKLLVTALIGVMAIGLTCCSRVKPTLACVPEDAMDIHYLGTVELRLGGVPEPYSRAHLVNRSSQAIEIELSEKTPVLIMHPHSVRTEQHGPDGKWVWSTPNLSEYSASESKVRIGAGDQADLYFFEEGFRKPGQEYRIRVLDARGSRELQCDYHSAPYVLPSQPG